MQRAETKTRTPPNSPLYRARTARGMTLAALAREVGVTEGQLSRIEHFGKPSLSTAKRLAELVDLRIEDIAFGSGA